MAQILEVLERIVCRDRDYLVVRPFSSVIRNMPIAGPYDAARKRGLLD